MKRTGVNLGDIIAKKAKEDERHGQDRATRSAAPANPYLTRPAIPEQALYAFLTQAIQTAKKNLPRGMALPAKEVREGFLCRNGGLYHLSCFISPVFAALNRSRFVKLKLVLEFSKPHMVVMTDVLLVVGPSI